MHILAMIRMEILQRVIESGDAEKVMISTFPLSCKQLKGKVEGEVHFTSGVGLDPT